MNVFKEYCHFLEEYLKKHTSLIVLLVDNKFNILEYNQAFARLFDKEGFLTHTNLSDYLSEENIEELLYYLNGQSQKFRMGMKGQEETYMIDCYCLFFENRYLMFWEKKILDASEIIQEFSILNNELTNMIRELNKRNNELKKANDTVNRLLRIDPLTEIYNRRFFKEAMDKAFSMLKRHSVTASLVMSDLDDFKKVNDYWGHETGDKVLIEFSSLLQKISRNEDVPARIGGEEFMILLHNTRCSYAEKYAERVRQKWSEIIVPPLTYSLSASFGVTEIQEDDSIDTAMARADKALYRAKEKGKNRVEVINQGGRPRDLM